MIVRAKNDNVLDIISTIPTNNLKQIHFQGGEPFLSNTHVQLLEKLSETVDFSDVILWYHSNGTIKVSDKVLKLWENFKMVDIYFSIDDLGTRMEYQRWPVKWKNLAKSVDTIVIMMGLSRIDVICKQLVAGGMDKKTPVAVIQNGTTPKQKMIKGTVTNIAKKVKENKITPPTNIIIGNVVNLSETIGWK